MRRGHRDRPVIPPLRRGERLAFALEPQHAHAVHAGCLQHVVEAIGNGAEIFADDDRLMPVGFQREQPQEVGHRISEIGAIGGRCAVRHQPELARPMTWSMRTPPV